MLVLLLFLLSLLVLTLRWDSSGLGVCLVNMWMSLSSCSGAQLRIRPKFLDVTVFRSRHPELNEYVAQVIEGARQLMHRGEADALVISINSTSNGSTTVLERFRFDIRLTTSAGISDALLRTQLRGQVRRLAVAVAVLVEQPSLAVHQRDEAAAGCEFSGAGAMREVAVA